MWYSIKKGVIYLNVFVKPNARKSAYIGIVNDEIHISLRAKPENGEANAELIKFIAGLLGVSKTTIGLLRGKTSRHKVLQLPFDERVAQFVKQNQS